jgi:hypothetical protein
MKQYLAAALLLAAPYVTAQSCNDFKKEHAIFEGQLLDSCRDRPDIHSCNMYLMTESGRVDLDNERFPYEKLKKRHGEQVRVTGTYYPDLAKWAACEKMVMISGAPQSQLEVKTLEKKKK